jgi:hypothetical protein
MGLSLELALNLSFDEPLMVLEVMDQASSKGVRVAYGGNAG